MAALVAGPAGVAGVLHSNDDLACTPGGARQVRLAAPGDVPGGGDTHCAICHLLRSLRAGLLVAPAPTMAPRMAEIPALDRWALRSDDPTLGVTGRSPPPEPSTLAG